MPTARPPLTNAGQYYVAVISITGTSVVLHSLYALATAPVGYQWFVLAGLTLLSGSFTIRIPTIPARLSVSEVFVFTAAILFGPAAATVIVVLDSLIISLWLRRASRQFARVLFNMSAPATSIWVASHAFFAIAAVPPLAVTPQPVLSLVVPLLLLALLYFLLNSWLIAIAVGYEKRTSAFFVWRHNFLWLSLNYFSGASVAALLLPYLQEVQHDAFIRVVRVAGILLPLLLISYLTFKTALGRVEDANRHLTELNRLYLSTIETLAMAIDAKDQITHGHIRRVQSQAVQLATQMGVNDPAMIKAIEAAALLHDMGKLAVPEYILNKPGPLTLAEFEKMKLHASAGADILSAIDFPYPVVPIVRHHHENWDGTGYPDGLSGVDIPVGARILSVVDCFDALTSDRPYRPRLPDHEALRIVANRRGTMYDPLAVDSFLRLHAEVSPDQQASSDISTSFSTITQAAAGKYPTLSENTFKDIAGSSGETLTLFSLAQDIASLSDVEDVAQHISRHVRRLVPFCLCILYVYDSQRDELLAIYAVGDNAEFVRGVRIPMGERLSGWVAAHRMAIRNSDPVLDIGEAVRVTTPRLQSCMSTPITLGSQLIGVLSLYSTARDSFSEEHQRIAEAISRQIAPIVRQSYETYLARVSPTNDPITGLPHLRSMEDVARVAVAGPTTEPISVVLIEVEDWSITNRRYGTATGEAILGAVIRVTRRSLRNADVLCRFRDRHFVVILPHTDRAAASEIRDRLTEALSLERGAFEHGRHMNVTMSCMSSPEDGGSLSELLELTVRRGWSEEGDGSSGIPPTSVH